MGVNGSVGQDWDVVVVGGGPAGSTLATLCRKYDPDLRVLILEKEKFPRDHIGESQLPAISAILAEMGCWDKVEAAQFPIKIGATYTWGRDQDEWDFDFWPSDQFVDEPRPAKYEGQRLRTAFQVDRAKYDDILLRHAEEMGTVVREQTQVRRVLVEGDRIVGLELDSGEVVRGRHYVDASGAVNLFRRALGVSGQAPRELRNVAFWDYWENAEWAVKIGVGGTRVQVRSLPYGWIWFIPLGPTRTSVGLITPVEHYKQSGLSPSEIYDKALQEQPHIRALLRNATPRGKVESCKDWSNVADRVVGENWFIVGEAAGFADPILAAGMTLAHQSARHAAYTILELERGNLDPKWLRDYYDERTRLNIRQHIRFAQYWYAANSCFTDLMEHCGKIAREAGFSLTPREAWAWLAQGGFSVSVIGVAAGGSFGVGETRRIVEWLQGEGAEYEFMKFNRFRLDLSGAQPGQLGAINDGRIKPVACMRRGERILPLVGDFGLLVKILQRTDDGHQMLSLLRGVVQRQAQQHGRYDTTLLRILRALEAMIHDGWVTGTFDENLPALDVPEDDVPLIHESDMREFAECLRQGDEAERVARGEVQQTRVEKPRRVKLAPGVRATPKKPAT